MATDLWKMSIPVRAGADLSAATSQFKAVTFAGVIAATSVAAAGILRYGGKNGENSTLDVLGVFKAQFGTAVGTAGYPLKATTSGFIVAAASGDDVIGRAMTITASGDIAQAMFNFLSYGQSNEA
jgi:hypothetical protein